MTYQEAQTRLGNKQQRKLKNNTYLVRLDPATIGIKLHDTYVVRLYENGNVELHSGGHYTMTTKKRMNKYSPVSVRQIGGTWYASYRGQTCQYHDGLTVS